MSSNNTGSRKMPSLRRKLSSSMGLKRSGSSGSTSSRRRLGDRSSSGGGGGGSGAMYVPGRQHDGSVSIQSEGSGETTGDPPSPRIEEPTEKADHAAAMQDESTTGTDATADDETATVATTEPIEYVTTKGPTTAASPERGTDEESALCHNLGGEVDSEHSAALSSEEATEYDYVFGFGSIMNTATHAPWLEGGNEDDNGGCGSDGVDGEGNQSLVPPQQRALLGAVARIKPSFGYRRGWNFRSSTGFTALGVSSCSVTEDDGDDFAPTAINGVLFRVHRSMMDGFDRREVGYDRVEIDREHVEMITSEDKGGGGVRSDTFTTISPRGSIWMYVPQQSYRAEADEDHPLLQSYVDTVMQGCLEWGGERMAREFVATTEGWSAYFLNDTPSSRRPWLFRRQYETIDRILMEDSSRTRYADRRHPEEFASTHLLRMMRGTWSVPRRNPNFTGRDAELGRIRARLADGDDGATPSSEQRVGAATATTSVSRLEVAGMGGVGKTQICTEYCYRYFPSHYGLVVWLNAAGGAETLSADYRQLMADLTGADVKDKDTDEVVAEVKARLFRSKVPWLLVFDNLEDRSSLDRFVPHGARSGHVLVTTRLVELGDQSRTLQLGCFDPQESVELLCRSAGRRNTCGERNVRAAHRLADRLGHLPLALGMAAAYMNRCDVDCDEYLTRYDTSAGGGEGSLLSHQAGTVVGYQLGVAASLSLSLNAIERENRTAWETLRLLCWLGPDHITKALLRSLISAKNASGVGGEKCSQGPITRFTNFISLEAALAAVSLVGMVVLAKNGTQIPKRSRGGIQVGLAIVAAVSISAATTGAVKQAMTTYRTPKTTPTPESLVRTYSANEFEQTDLVWKILKSFSLLSVKEGRGSIHRLLAQALRATQSEGDCRSNLDCCVRAVIQSWQFKPEKVETWQDSLNLLEHVKSVVQYSFEHRASFPVQVATLSKEAGVFSAMALNRFVEAQYSLELSLEILSDVSRPQKADLHVRAAALLELGRVFRYQGSFAKAEEVLQQALEIYNSLSSRDAIMKRGVADTLHELGVLEVKKHCLDSAAAFLQQALDLRRAMEVDLTHGDGVEADCAATLHQLAAVHVARKPPALDRAEALLQQALGLTMQIGQRAATLKQLARVAIRQGLLDQAESYLTRALELYVELYGGESTLHINVATVKFQLGALAAQREQFEQAWIHFSECLRIRRHVYAYACSIQDGYGSTEKDANPAHIDVSTVLHELGCVAFAQQRMAQACRMFNEEKIILERLDETSSQHQRILQARLTNLTWLRKCAKQMGDEELEREISVQRSDLKKHKSGRSGKPSSTVDPDTRRLQHEALNCRLVARQFALAGKKNGSPDRMELLSCLARLDREIQRSPSSEMRLAALEFQRATSEATVLSNAYSKILEASDNLRDVLREHGLQINDSFSSRGEHA